jgi:hypothetical protein
MFTCTHSYLHSYCHVYLHTQLLTQLLPCLPAHSYLHRYCHVYLHTVTYTVTAMFTCTHSYLHSYCHVYLHTVTYTITAMFTCTPLMSTSCSLKSGSYPLVNIHCMMEPDILECPSPSACPNSCTATRNRLLPVNKQQLLSGILHNESLHLAKHFAVMTSGQYTKGNKAQ